MDPKLLHYYNRELQHIREMGGEFAREFPKIAGRLGLEGFECADPYVERLLEGFAFLAGRVQLKIDAEFPRFTQHLCEVLYPHYLAPTPSMTVVQFTPSLNEGALASGFPVPRGSVLRGLLGRGDQTACEYRTAHDVTLWPVELVHAEYTGFVGDLPAVRVPGNRTARAALRLRLRTTAAMNFAQTALKSLPLFVRGADEQAIRLYEPLMANTMAALVRPGNEQKHQVIAAEAAIRPVGFEDREALLPYGPRSFQGYRLLHEYFAFPQRYMFVELGGLEGAVKRCTSPELEVVILFDRLDPALEGTVSPANFALHCTPAVNLFPRRADRIHLSDRVSEYHVVPDRTRPLDFEVHTVTEVVGYGAATDEKQDYWPLYGTSGEVGGTADRAYFTVHRVPRLLSERQRANGPRSSYVGSELFVSLVDGNEGPYRSQMRQLGVAALCTNRDLPLHMTLGQGRTDFTLESGAPVESIRCVAGPTPPRASFAHGDVTWRLIGHLALGQLGMVSGPDNDTAAPLREALRLYADLDEAAVRRQIDGVKAITTKPITRRLPGDGPLVFGRGTEITLALDDIAFHGAGVFLLGAVLDRFFARFASINAFTETVLKTTQRGEINRWPARTGLRPLL